MIRKLMRQNPRRLKYPVDVELLNVEVVEEPVSARSVSGGIVIASAAARSSAEVITAFGLSPGGGLPLSTKRSVPRLSTFGQSRSIVPITVSLS